MKAILVVDLDDTFMPLDEDTITLEKGTIKYRDINRNPFAITIKGLKLKSMPQKINELSIENTMKKINGKETVILEEAIKLAKQKGYNTCIDEILGDAE